ncbi:SDR family oxidoreductase [Corynebacterium atrinae]|uniref:SDR family oxidoreductase n=1 Tax=Corynebacterium atrinae TaxID=1336740 RepID=UPI0025B58BC0|nr:SDR family oxidoreductase [Corynebacterium atrinae]
MTGAASGIGRATAMLLAQSGVNLVLVDRHERNLKKVVATIGSHSCIALSGDLTDQHVAEKVLETAVKTHGRLDGVVFAAGSNGRGTLRNTQINDFNLAMKNNVVLHLLLSQAVLKRHVENALEQFECSLVYVASKASIAPSTGFGAYPLAKAAELQLARVIALEGGRFGIRANVVNPGAVLKDSDFWEPDLLRAKAEDHGISPQDLGSFYAERTLLGVTVTTEDVARMLAFMVSPWSRATTGAIIAVDGGLPVSFGR